MARVLAIYEALNRRDWVALQRQFAADLVLRIAGKSHVAGEHRGLGAAIALATKIERRVVPKQSTLDRMVERLDQVEAEVTVSFEMPTGEFRARLREVFRFGEDDLVREVWVKAVDQRAVDAFLGSAPSV